MFLMQYLENKRKEFFPTYFYLSNCNGIRTHNHLFGNERSTI